MVRRQLLFLRNQTFEGKLYHNFQMQWSTRRLVVRAIASGRANSGTLFQAAQIRANHLAQGSGPGVETRVARVRPGTCRGKQSTSTEAAARLRRRAQRCKCGDCGLPFRNAATAAEASLRRMQQRPPRLTCWAKDSKASTPPRASQNGCWLTSQSAGHEPTSSRSLFAGAASERSHQRATAAQP